MRKVSRSMLATIAALQSGAHTRRKVKYLREQALVSGLYPHLYEETISGSVWFSGGKLFDVPIITDTINGSVAFAGGELIQIGPIEYIIQPEAETVAGSATFAGGELKTVVINHAQPAETIAGSATFAGGELKVVVVNYDNYAPETVTGNVTFAGGSLETV